MVKDKITGKPRGYAFIEFENEQDLKVAYKASENLRIDGRLVVVDVERGRTVTGWKPRRLAGGLGYTRSEKPDTTTSSSVMTPPSMSGYGGSRGSGGGYRGGSDRGYRGGDRGIDRDRERDRGYRGGGDRDGYRGGGDRDRGSYRTGPPPSRYGGYGYPDESPNGYDRRPSYENGRGRDRDYNERRRSRSPRNRDNERESRRRSRSYDRDRRKSRSRDRR